LAAVGGGSYWQHLVVGKLKFWYLKGKFEFKCNVQENNDPIAGQDVPHLHFHIIPRVEKDGLKLWDQNTYEENEATDIAEKIKNKIY
jgi:diadenosine tetraphosphate (Ap4A) HIT family hydrolase